MVQKPPFHKATLQGMAQFAEAMRIALGAQVDDCELVVSFHYVLGAPEAVTLCYQKTGMPLISFRLPNFVNSMTVIGAGHMLSATQESMFESALGKLLEGAELQAFQSTRHESWSLLYSRFAPLSTAL